MSELDKVLIVASLEESAERAYHLVRALRENGYSVDLCHIPNDLAGEKKSKIKADKLLNEETGISEYKGVIFLDDGGDLKLSSQLAKRADEKALAVGAIASGGDVLSEVGLLKDKEICSNLSENASKGAKVIDQPAVRCDNIITSSGFIEGFALLFLSTIGGKVRKVVRSEDQDDETKTSSLALVLCKAEKWPSYWRLAKELEKKNTLLLLAEWDDLNLKEKKVSQCMLLDTKRNDVVGMNNVTLPLKTWYRMPVSEQRRISDVKKLETAGCVNLNSAESMEKLADKFNSCMVLSHVTDQGQFSLENALSAEKLLVSGKRWARARYAAMRAIRISGHGETALVSVYDKGVKHWVADGDTLAKFLKSSFSNKQFLVQTELGAVDEPGSHLELTLRRKANGWKVSSLKVHSIIGQAEVKKIEKKAVDSAIHLAKCAAIIMQSELSSPDGVNEVQTKIVFNGEEPKLIRLKSAPPEAENGLEDASDFLAPMAGPRRWIIERELAAQGIWYQNDGTFAIKTNGKMERMIPDKAIEYVWNQATKAIGHEVKLMNQNASEKDICLAAMASRAARHRVWTLIEFYRESGIFKFAESNSTVKGWYANLDLPMSERYYEYHEGTEEVIESDQYDSFLKNQPRYNPEYDKDSPTETAGFYAVFVEPQRGPYSWYQRFTEGNYPMRNGMKP